VSRRITQEQTSRHPYEQQGVVIPFDRFGCLTDGAVRVIETGLPVLMESSHGPPLLDYDQVAEDLQEAKLRLLDGFIDPPRALSFSRLRLRSITPIVKSSATTNGSTIVSAARSSSTSTTRGPASSAAHLPMM
jgi:hypothetical protein